MAFRAPLSLPPMQAEERLDAQARWYRQHLRQLRHIISARDEGLLTEADAQTRMVAVILRGLGEGPT